MSLYPLNCYLGEPVDYIRPVLHRLRDMQDCISHTSHWYHELLRDYIGTSRNTVSTQDCISHIFHWHELLRTSIDMSQNSATTSTCMNAGTHCMNVCISIYLSIYLSIYSSIYLCTYSCMWNDVFKSALVSLYVYVYDSDMCKSKKSFCKYLNVNSYCKDSSFSFRCHPSSNGWKLSANFTRASKRTWNDWCCCWNKIKTLCGGVWCYVEEYDGWLMNYSRIETRSYCGTIMGHLAHEYLTENSIETRSYCGTILGHLAHEYLTENSIETCSDCGTILGHLAHEYFTENSIETCSDCGTILDT